jgi:hypothetical protein
MATEATTRVNKIYNLNWHDVARGLLLFVLSAVITAVYEAITQNGIGSIEWKEVGGIGVTAALSYLIKNFFTPTEVVVINPPQGALEKVKEGAVIKAGTTVLSNSTPAAVNGAE